MVITANLRQFKNIFLDVVELMITTHIGNTYILHNQDDLIKYSLGVPTLNQANTVAIYMHLSKNFQKYQCEFLKINKK